MSTDVTCEVCGENGSYPMWARPKAPFGWFMSEVAIDCKDSEDPREVRKDDARCGVVFVCSRSCRDKFWTAGRPSPYRDDYPSETNGVW